MNKNLSFASVLAAGLVLGGCVTDRYKPAESFPGNRPSAAPPPENPTEAQRLAAAAAQPPAPVEGTNWQAMFDGQTLTGWRETDYGDGGRRVEARTGLILLKRGSPFTGINWTNDAPKVNYEISLEAMRVNGSDFFCGLTFPVKDSFGTLIVGGWGGSIVGISSLDGADASENETTQYISFETGRWYRIRLRVTEQKIEAWVEQKKVVNATITGRKVSLRFGDIELSKPLGIACWDTGGAVREIKLRRIATPDSPAE